MKKFMALALLTLSFESFAQYSSYSVCRARVKCYSRDYYGNVFVSGFRSCEAYGSTYAFGPTNMSTACTWEAVDGVGVRCTGYSQVAGHWRWNVFQASCY